MQVICTSPFFQVGGSKQGCFYQTHTGVLEGGYVIINYIQPNPYCGKVWKVERRVGGSWDICRLKDVSVWIHLNASGVSRIRLYGIGEEPRDVDADMHFFRIFPVEDPDIGFVNPDIGALLDMEHEQE